MKRKKIKLLTSNSTRKEMEKRLHEKSPEREREDIIPEKLPLYGPLDIPDLKNYYETSKKNFAELYNKTFPSKVKIEEFDILSVLGEGSFGIVLLVRDKENNSLYAMKALEKRHIFEMKQIKHALNEKRILQGIDFPFGVRMEYFSKDNSYIYFFMPFVSGGELFRHLRRERKFTENRAKFYAAQVVLGLEYLHNLSLIYRDLKPENLLIDHFGYLKITDFGFTKPVKTRTYTFCGTPEYMAPEVISGHGYGQSVDWWSLGVFIYEMNLGNPPYNGDQLTMFRLILANQYIMPTSFSTVLKHLLDRLLQVDVTKRFGNLRKGADDIKNHEWFRDIDFFQLLNRRRKAPFVPSIGNGEIVNNFHNLCPKGSFLKISNVDEFKDEFNEF